MKKILSLIMVGVMAFTSLPAVAMAQSKAPTKAPTKVVTEQRVDARAAKKPAKLDKRHLKDGVYKVNGKMVKSTNKKQASMANKAFNHNVVLTVKDGKYYLTLDFKGMKIGDKFGYLGKLKFYRTGYKKNKYGAPVGNKYYAKTLTYQKNKNGKFIKHFGKKCPDKVKFRLIPEALSYGWVPLEVFVPIMENIGKGLGTQSVYLKLDWSTLRK